MAGFTSTVSPPSNAESVAQWLMTQTTNMLSNAITEPMQALFEVLGPLIVVGLTVQFLVYAFALMHGAGGMTVTEFFKKAVAVAFISGIFGAGGFYQSNIASAMIGIPDDVAHLVSKTDSIAAQVDSLQAETTKATKAMSGATDSGWFNFLPSTREVLVSILSTMIRADAAVVGGVILVLTIVCKVGMALVAGVGPVFIAALLFEPTKQLFNSWVSQALNFIFLGLLAGLVGGFMLELNVALLQMVASKTAEGSTDILALFGAFLLVGIASLIVLLMLPGLAAGLSGGFGAQLGVGSTGRGAFTSMRIASMFRRPRAPAPTPASSGK